jgi:histidinol-phosphate aminotransferase
MAFQGFCDENRPVAYPVPTYSLYPVLADIQNCTAIEIPFDDEFNLPAKLAATNAALTIVCNPNAPTGSFISVDELASLADEIDGVLLIDEAYVDFAENNCTTLVKDFDNVVILRSLSKGYSLAGLRFGYAIAQPEMIASLMKVKDSYNVDAVAIAVATAAIEDQKYFKENVEKVKSERARLTEQLTELGFNVPGSCSNFVLAQCLPPRLSSRDEAAGKNGRAAEIYKELEKRNIFVRYFNDPKLEDKLRITVGTPEQDDKLLLALKEIIK